MNMLSTFNSTELLKLDQSSADSQLLHMSSMTSLLPHLLLSSLKVVWMESVSNLSVRWSIFKMMPIFKEEFKFGFSTVKELEDAKALLSLFKASILTVLNILKS